jgi:hypothetical protein
MAGAFSSISRVLVVDDDANARQGYSYPIEELKRIPVLEPGRIEDLETFIETLQARADAVLCDYHLKKKNYAVFNGDVIVAACYRREIPAVLCTTYTDSDITLMRGKRRFIPALLKPDEVSPDSIALAWQTCIDEFAGQFQPDRKPIRTLIKVEEVVLEAEYLYVVIPSWNATSKVRLMFADLPKNIRALVEENRHFHAAVNIGTERPEDLFFESWESS